MTVQWWIFVFNIMLNNLNLISYCISIIVGHGFVVKLAGHIDRSAHKMFKCPDNQRRCILSNLIANRFFLPLPWTELIFWCHRLLKNTITAVIYCCSIEKNEGFTGLYKFMTDQEIYLKKQGLCLYICVTCT